MLSRTSGRSMRGGGRLDVGTTLPDANRIRLLPRTRGFGAGTRRTPPARGRESAVLPARSRPPRDGPIEPEHPSGVRVGAARDAGLGARIQNVAAQAERPPALSGRRNHRGFRGRSNTFFRIERLRWALARVARRMSGAGSVDSPARATGWTTRIPLRTWLVRPRVALVALAAAYFALSFVLSLSRLYALMTGNWDLGIFQQALWTGAHGGTFFEVGDFEVSGARSYLIVHPAFVMLALAPLYAAFPSPVTLFAIQSGLLAAAAIPLYLLSRRASLGPWIALAPAVAYLVAAPLLAGNLYDFHLESFLPLELISLFLLWHQSRYAAGFAVAALAFVTLEVTPLLVGFLALYFLIPSSAEWRAFRARDSGPNRVRGRFRLFARAIASALRSSRRARASVALIAVSIGVYGLLRYLEWTVVPTWLGLPPRFPSSGVLGYWIGIVPGQVGLPPTPAQALPLDLGSRLRNWVLVYALFAFVPLFALRTQVLQIPWFAFTMLQSRYVFTQLGWQNPITAVAPLAIGFAFGLAVIANRWPERPLAAASRSTAEEVPARPMRRSVRRPSVSVGAFVGALVAALVAANAAAGPLDPAAKSLIGPVGPGYLTALPFRPGYSSLERLTALVPAGTSVAATNDLFDFVADNPNAYAFVPDGTVGVLPGFSSAHRPAFVLLSEYWAWTVPSWLLPMLSDPTVYGFWGETWTTAHGPALLFGPPDPGRVPMVLGRPPPLPRVFPADELGVGPSGERIAANASGELGLIRSVPGKAGFCWSGPDANLPAGRYVASLRLAAIPLRPSAPPSPSTGALRVVFTTWIGPGQGNFSVLPNGVGDATSITFGGAGSGAWTWVDIPFVLPEPVVHLGVAGGDIPASGTYVAVADLVLLANSG
jgi:uncharacterized membrane protein